MRKVKSKQKNFAEKAYRSTRLDYGYTQRRITDMLEQLNITDVRMTQQGNDYTIEFLVKMHANEGVRKVRINVPVGSELEETYKQAAHRKDVLFRILFYHLKDKFVAVTSGLKEFEEEFLADLVIVHHGKEVRLGEVLAPRYREQLKDSKVAVFSIKSGE